MALTRCLNYLIKGDENVFMDCHSQSEMIEVAAKNAKAIIIYDIIDPDEDDEDESLARLISMHTISYELDLSDEDGTLQPESISEKMPIIGEIELSVANLWEFTIIPTLCQSFETEELNSFVYLSVDIIAE